MHAFAGILRMGIIVTVVEAQVGRIIVKIAILQS